MKPAKDPREDHAMKSEEPIRIHVAESRAGADVHVTGPGGDARGTLTAAELGEFRRWGPQLDPESGLDRAIGIEWGERLFGRVLAGDAARVYAASGEAAEARGERLRVVLEYEAGWTALHEVPWELLFDPRRGRFLAVDRDRTFSRRLRLSVPRRWPCAGGQVRVLATGASPEGFPALATRRELDRVAGEIARRATPGQMACWKVPVTDGCGLRGEFVQAEDLPRPFHAWHHAGHGGFEGGRFRLMMQGPGGGAELADGGELARFLAGRAELALVVLNVCLGASGQGLSASLGALNVPAVIGHSTRVGTDVAEAFAGELWRHLPGHPVDRAVQEAREFLAAGPGPVDFARVVLFLRTADGPCLIPPGPGRSMSTGRA